MMVARLTVELERPVPLAPLTITTQLTRPGKRVQLIDQALHADGNVVARARALRIRTTSFELPAGDVVPSPSPPAAGIPAPLSPSEMIAYHSDGVEMRFVS